MRSYRATLGAGIDGLRIETGARPVPGRSEVVVRVRAVSLSYRELMILRGWYPLPVKANVIPVSGVTAWNALTGGRGLQSGETVLTLGSGGVSLCAIQFAKATLARRRQFADSRRRQPRPVPRDDARDRHEPYPPGRRSRIALRTWRTRRRVSQLELALRARTSQRHISFIESGRSLPGRSMVIRLAEALEMPLRERNVLLASAGYAPVCTETSLDDPSLGAVREAVDRVLDGHNPYPAVVTNRYGELLSSNRAFTMLTQGVMRDLLAEPVNVPRLLLHAQGLAPRIANLDEWGWHIVDAVQQQALRNPDPKLEAWRRNSRKWCPP